MNATPVPVFLGLLGITLLFLVCLILGATARILYLYLKGFLTFKPKQKRTRKKRAVKPFVKSIEIDPSEIDRIYVKKSD